MQKSLVAFFLYILKDLINCGFKFPVIVRASFEKIFENIFCVFLLSVLTVRIVIILLSTVLFIDHYISQVADQFVDPFAFHLHADLVYDHLAESGQTSSRTLRPFSRSVLPVSTISTITSDRPTIGASSMEPFNLISSTVWCF